MCFVSRAAAALVLVKMGIFPNFRDENKKCLKPPPSQELAKCFFDFCCDTFNVETQKKYISKGRISKFPILGSPPVPWRYRELLSDGGILLRGVHWSQKALRKTIGCFFIHVYTSGASIIYIIFLSPPMPTPLVVRPKKLIEMLTHHGPSIWPYNSEALFCGRGGTEMSKAESGSSVGQRSSSEKA